MLDVLSKLIATLNRIEVKGKENLDMLLGCIQTLEKLKSLVKEKAEQAEEETQGDHNNEPRENL